jgi:alpha-1,2-mannosyltransferase
MVAATVVALGVRLFTLSRPGFLTQSTEYDDGVYLGAAIRLTQGVMPYKDFAFVQPPGILLLMSPVALFARATSTVAGLALARVLTVLASTACIPLAGNLVRYRGTLVTALTCFILAIYPSDIAAAHTLLLEPWMNLLVLIAANLAFSRGRLSPSVARLAGAGLLIGVAGVVKFWSGAPAVVLLVIVALVCRSAAKSGEPGAWRRLVAYLGGLVVAFVGPLLPFVLSAPGTFYRSTVLYQAARVGTYTPLSLRLAHITGVIDLLDYWGRITLSAGSNSVFGQAVDADTTPTVPHALPFVAAALLVAVVVGGFVLARRSLAAVEWFALATCVGALAAILGYSAFFYHYPAFPGPWLALVAGVSIAALVERAAGAWAGLPVRPFLVGGVGLVLAFACVLQLIEVSGLATPKRATEISSLIPPGSCVVTDEVALLIAANRFESTGPCPVVIDSLATTLVLTHGESVQGGADNDRAAIAAWQAILLKAQYVWLSPNHWKRIPFGWDSAQWGWFTDHFRQIAPAYKHGQPDWILGIGQLFVPRT